MDSNYKPDNRKIGYHIYQLAEDNHISVDDICFYCEVSETAVYNWFRGKLPGRDNNKDTGRISYLAILLNLRN